MAATRARLEALVETRLGRRLERAVTAGLVSSAAAEAVRVLPFDEPRPAPLPTADVAASPETGREPGRWQRIVERLEADAPAAEVERRVGDADPSAALETGGALFGASGGAAGAQVFLALDDEAPLSSAGGPGQGLRPLFGEYVWWFVGTLLVLGGSVMGVREAFRALSGPLRPAVVAAAFFVYHGLFLGLAALVARRSALAGRVLAGISVGLLPILFAAVAALFDAAQGFGVGATVVTAVLTGLTLYAASRRFEARGSLLLPCFILPSLLAMVPLGSSRLAVDAHAGLPFLGVAQLAAAVLVLRVRRNGRVATLWAAAFGALALGIFAVVGVPGGALRPGDNHPLMPVVALLWGLVVAQLGVIAAGDEAVRLRWPKAAPTFELLFLAAVAAAGVSAIVMSVTRPVTSESLLLVAAPALAAGSFFVAQRRYGLALDIGLLFATTAATLFGRFCFPLFPPLWFVFAVLVPSSALVLSALERFAGARRRMVLWGALLGAIAVVATMSLEDVSARPWLPTVACAAILGGAAHSSGVLGNRRVHYLGGLAMAVALGAHQLPTEAAAWGPRAVLVALGLSVGYGLLALVDHRGDGRLRPLDDISLLVALVAAALVWGAYPSATELYSGAARWFVVPGGSVRTLERWAPLGVALWLLLRSLRDRSRLVALASAGAFAALLLLALGVDASRGMGAWAFAAGLAAAAFQCVGALRSAPGEVVGRVFLGAKPLPFAARGRALLDGFAWASLGLVLLCAGSGTVWLAARVEHERILVVVGVAMAIVALLTAFLTESLASMKLRGTMTALVSTAALIVLAALANRLGRPLPPAVVGRNLTLVAAGVWLFARLLFRYGPGLGAWLGRRVDGGLYHYVPHAGVLALGLLLAVDALLVGAPALERAFVVVPPMMLVGAAVSAALLARSFGHRAFVHLGLAAALCAAPLVAVQHAVLGPALVPLDVPGGRWVLASLEATCRSGWLDVGCYLRLGDTLLAMHSRALVGVAGFSVVAALLALLLARVQSARIVALRWLLGADEEDALPMVRSALATWVVVASLVIFGAAAFTSDARACGVVIVAGALLIAAGSAARGGVVVVVGAATAIHALALREVQVPSWSGPALALLGLLAALLVPELARSFGRDAEREARRANVVALLLAPMALTHALATGAPTDRLDGLQSLWFGVQDGVAGGLLRSYSLALTLFVSAATLAASSLREGEGRRGSAFFSGILLGEAAFLVVPPSTTVLVRYEDLVSVFGAPLSVSLALAAVVAHLVHVLSAKRRPRSSDGFGAARDSLLLQVLVTVGLHVRFGMVALSSEQRFGLLAMALCSAVALHAVLRNAVTLHVYVLQLTVVGAYAIVRRDAAIAPLTDALCGLLYGFALIGVAVLARRRNVAPVEIAVRRFVALLPLALALLVGDGATTQSALLGLGSSVLYGALALAQRSRIFGSLAALAANVAALVFALSQGLDGIEVYVAPLGLFVLMLSQLFEPLLPTASRASLRVLGGLLLYAPAALKVALQLGRAQDGSYSVAFGLLCMLGALTGMLLRIRAYLALGALFLTLDVVANLVHAGLRDHRIGFLILSTSGLLVLATMILTTLKRELVRSALARLNRRLGTWQ